jgi:hypothetical protein
VITLTGGHFQCASGAPLANGSIVFQLNADARVVASPYGHVPAKLKLVLQLNALGALAANAQIWSNAELTPQLSPTLLGTYYLVTLYDANNSPVSDPMWWIFPNLIGAMVDIATMVAFIFDLP